MEIIYLSRSVLPSKAANSVHVMKMGQALAQNGHDVTLIAAKSAENQEASLFDYYGVQSNFEINLLKGQTDQAAGLLLYLANFYLHIRKVKPPELFYSRDLFTLSIATLRFNVPFIFEAHKPPTTFVHTYLTRRLFKNKNFQRLVVITGALKEEYLRLFPALSAEKIVVVPDGADIPATGTDNHAPKKGDRLTIGYVGNLYPGRGMEIIHAVAKELPQYDFHIVGGNAKDISYWQNICRELKNIYFKGFIPHGELHRCYAQIDIVLAPYQTKVTISGGGGDTVRWMSPLKIFEYMAHAKPIIASDLPALREVLTDGHNALLCKPDCVDEWVDAIQLLAQDRNRRAQLAANAFSCLKENYTWQNRASNVFHTLINSNYPSHRRSSRNIVYICRKGSKSTRSD